MTTTVLTDEQIDAILASPGDMRWVIATKKERYVLFARAIEQAVLQSPETQARMEAYAAAKVREAQQWQPIETAPKDGTAILIGNERGAWIAKYEPVHPSGYRPANPWFSLMLNHDHLRKVRPHRPTHWMPLPAPPFPGPVEPTT